MTTRVFQIRFDVSRYQSLLVDGDDGVFRRWKPMLELDGRPRAAHWAPPPVYSDQPLLERPDFWQLIGCPTGIVVHPSILEIVGPLLLSAGELLPLPYREMMFRLCNVTKVYDCLDASASLRDADDVITGFVFYEHRLPDEQLFKIADDHYRMVQLLTIERGPGHETNFKSFVEQQGLSGLVFRELWNSNEGPLPDPGFLF